MKTISKILVLALAVIMIVSVYSSVKAATSDLVAYIGTSHNINGMIWEISNDGKKKLTDFASKLDNATADSVLSDIIAAENVVRNSGVTNHNQLTAAQQSQIVAYAQSAAQKAGGTLTVDLAKRTFTLSKGGKVVLSGNIDDVIVDPGTASGGTSSTGGSAASSATTSKSKLLYTGSNYAVYMFSALAIVAVAVVANKRRV